MAQRWQAAIVALVSASAKAHAVEIDLLGEKVRSKPATGVRFTAEERTGGRPSASPVIGSAHIPRRLNRCSSLTSEPISIPAPPSRPARPAPRNTPGGVPDAA